MTQLTVEERLISIEGKLDNIINSANERKKHCDDIENYVTNLRIEQGKQGVIVYLFSAAIAAAISAVFGWMMKR